MSDLKVKVRVNFFVKGLKLFTTLVTRTFYLDSTPWSHPNLRSEGEGPVCRHPLIKLEG